MQQIVKMFNNHFNANRIYADLKKWKINPRFLEARSVTEYIENKLDYYDRILENYQQKDGKGVKSREMYKLLEDFKDEVKRIKEARGDDYDDVDLDTLSQTSISLLDYVKLLQKDENYIRDINKLQDSLLKDLLRARELELEQLNIDGVLNTVYEELFDIADRVGMPHLPQAFHHNVRKKLAEINGTTVNLLGNPELENFLKEQKERYKEPKSNKRKYFIQNSSKTREHHRKLS